MGSRSCGAGSPSPTIATTLRTRSRTPSLPRPSRCPARSSTPCAPMQSSIAAIPWPIETISASRRAESGAIVARSSMPAACVELTTSYDTGRGQRAGVGGERLHRDAEHVEGVLGEPVTRCQPVRKPRERRVHELEAPLCGSREHGRQHDPELVERRRQRERVEVAGAHDRAALWIHYRIALRRVELELELGRARSRSVARGAVHLRHGPEAERVLQVPDASGSRGRFRRAAHAAARSCHHPGERSARGHRNVEDREVPREGLEAQCRRPRRGCRAAGRSPTPRAPPCRSRRRCCRSTRVLPRRPAGNAEPSSSSWRGRPSARGRPVRSSPGSARPAWHPSSARRPRAARAPAAHPPCRRRARWRAGASWRARRRARPSAAARPGDSGSAAGCRRRSPPDRDERTCARRPRS